jgi:hypothetical protein
LLTNCDTVVNRKRFAYFPLSGKEEEVNFAYFGRLSVFLHPHITVPTRIIATSKIIETGRKYMTATDTGVGVWEKGVRAARVSALVIFEVSVLKVAGLF